MSRSRAILLRRDGVTLMPHGALDAEAVMRVPGGRLVEASIHLERDPAATKRWRALLHTAAPSMPFPMLTNPDSLSDYVKIMTGHAVPTRRSDGSIAWIPRSTAVSEMDGIAFGEFLAAAENLIGELLAGADIGTLRREAEAYMLTEGKRCT